VTELIKHLFDQTARSMLATQLRLTGVEINHISWARAEPRRPSQ
jgi:hypothetical protein